MVGKQIIQLENGQKTWVQTPPMGVWGQQITTLKDVQQHQPLGESNVKHCDIVLSDFLNDYNYKYW